MARIGKKLRSLEGGQVMFQCPGCGHRHAVTVEPNGGPCWGWNRDADAPTFTPSILARGVRWESGGELMTDEESDEYDRIFASGGTEAVFASKFGSVCHSFVTDGRIAFLTDCTHSLAGQTVDLPDWPDYTGETDGHSER